MTCTSSMVVNKDSNCIELSRQNSITIDAFRYLNPHINCKETLRKDSTICVSTESIANCSSIQAVPINVTCLELAQSLSISLPTLLNLNPVLNCEKLNETEQICAGTGYFRDTQCTETQRITPDFDSCAKISKLTGLIKEQIETLNPTINCTSDLKWATLICVSNLGMNTRTAQETIVSKLDKLVPGLNSKFREYSSNPSNENSMGLNQLMMNSLLKPDVNSLLKELYRNDPQIRTIFDSQHPLPRQSYCDQVLSTSTTDAIKNCFCENNELLVYCFALSVRRFQENEAKFEKNETLLTRSKRAVGCQFVFPSSGKTILDKMMSGAMNCFGGGCSIPIGLFEVNMDANICLPVISQAEEGGKRISVCYKQQEECDDANPDNVQGLKYLADKSVDSSLQLCAIGHNIIEKLLSADVGLCFKIISVNYFGFVGKLNVGSSINLIVFKLSGGASIKVHDMAFPEMCKDVEVECEYYCKWRDMEIGKAYGYIEGRVLSIFGWDGIKVFEETFNEPDKLGCEAGSKAAIILRNDRSCKNPLDTRVWRCCWSKDTKTCTFELMEQERGFQFRPNLIGNTLFTCEFIDRELDDEHERQKIGFDVYGGTSFNKGKRNFYYVAKNDGMYFGTVKYKEDKLIKAWKEPCEEAEPQPDKKPVDKDSEEPEGISSVAAASCGKRIVGYYTGWGEREISENQLKKLTHVIFAFVAMKPDGSVEFGPVSEDDSGPEAGAKAKRRFLDMKEKARKVQSGVQILFAVGGWDNSQYFSSMAGSFQKRKVFIDSVEQFISEYKIDGIDLDWEYPDLKGGDKENHVALLKELRERLDNLQKEKRRESKYLVTLATAAGEWNLRDGYDLKGVLKYADFLNVMTYDYYGAWESKWGAYTGPPSPLFFGSLKGFSGKLNADFTMKFYSCKTKQPSQLNMGVPFYGRYWKNVQGPINGTDGMWRTAQEVNGKFEGGYVGWRNLGNEGWNKGATSWHEKTQTPYIFNSGARMFLGFENEKSLARKVKYATDKNLGGLMIWALDLDDDADTLLNLVSSAGLCSGGHGKNDISYVCNPIDDIRWWTPENSDETIQGQCGKSAKLINGYYPVCDPDDPGFSCCGAAGYCGSDEKYCNCKTCVNYRKDPLAIVKEPTKPTREVQWYLMNDPDGKRGRCGKDAPLLNGKMAICNPDDDSKHCCSNGGYCGTGKEYCECDGCVDYRKKN